MEKTKPCLIHPFLFAIFPILFLFSHNKEQVLPYEMLLPVVIVILFALVLLILARLLLGDATRAGICVSTFLLLFFSYGHVRNVVVLLYDKFGMLTAESGMIAPGLVVLLLCSMLFAVIFYLLVRTKKNLNAVASILNVVSATVVVISLVTIIHYEFRTKRLIRTSGRSERIVDADESLPFKDALPDIYYLIFDRYTSANALHDFFGYDNSKFVDRLTEKGFYVASESRANYLSTWRSLASSLNMRHITNLVDELGDEYSDMTILYDMVSDNDVVRFLKTRGYKYVLVGSVGGSTRRNELADITYNYSFGIRLSDFGLQLIELSMLHPIVVRIFVGDARNLARNRILFQFEKLNEIPAIVGPKFVFAHILIPHDPYVFDSTGELPAELALSERGDAVNYLNQLIFANKKITILVDSILLKSKTPPVIILQGDEGAYTVGFTSDVDLKAHSNILNAYHIPNREEGVLYASVTPVNTFRIIFNQYFGTNYPLLADKTYMSQDYQHPLKFVDITDSIID